MSEKPKTTTVTNETRTAPDIDPIGEEVKLDKSTVLQRLNPDLLSYLQSQDPRVRHFAGIVANRMAQTGSEFLEGGDGYTFRWDEAEGGRYDFYTVVGNHVGAQIEKDFEGEEVMVRSTIASTIKPFPWWQSENPEDRDVRTVLDILASGSDSGKDKTRVGHIVNRQLNYQTLEWLDRRMGSLLLESNVGGKYMDEARQTFPVVIVYHKEAFVDGRSGHGWNNLVGPPEERIAAIYITDKVNRTR